jgi:Cytochrome c oxidase subunit IV
MRVEGWLFIGCGIFFGGSDIVYWYTSYDPTGTSALALAVGLALLAGFYVLFTGRRLPMRPEDDYDGEIAQGTGEIGFFSPHSWWPLWVGLAAATVAVGLAIGWWLVLLGVVGMMFASVGLVFEYYRGQFSH